jgi:trk system potassium uptake protein TrkA
MSQLHVVIGGYGRVGRFLAHILESEGHSVSVIDRSEAVLEEIENDIRGQKFMGEVFDKEVLELAGIAQAHAYAAVTSGDNSNVVSARIARERYNVPTVVARIYDPARAVIYRGLGIRTISSVDWTCEQVLGMITHPEARSEYRFGDGSVRMMEIDAPAEFIGHRLVEIEVPSDLRIAAVVREAKAVLPGPGYVVERGDRLFINVSESGQARLDQLICTA